MTTAADTISQVLTRLANDRRRTANQYINAVPRPGSDTTPRRLLNDTGFLEECQFTYIVPNRANYSYDDTGNPRTIKQIVVVAYGVTADYRRLTSPAPADRVIHPPTATASAGVAPFTGDARLLMSGELNADTYAAAKTARALRAATTPQGPAAHFTINRRGDILVGPSIDAETSVIAAYMTQGIFINVESALAISREDHAARRYDRLIEMPLSNIQLVTLGTLSAKLLTALSDAVPRNFTENLLPSEAGFTYQWPSALSGATPFNFRDTPPTLSPEASTFDYTYASQTGFFDLVARQGTYSLATDVWRPLEAPQATAGREEVRTAIGTVDTAGAASTYLGAYVTLAMGERSNEMQASPRRQMFIQRQRGAVTDSEDSGSAAAEVATTGDASLLPTEEPANTGPHTYDFATGRWGDNGTY